MRKDEYRKHLDKITCTEEFRSRMEDMLSAEADGEYADSVSTVERAGKINYHRWTALAASAVLMVGIGGVMLHTMKSGPDVPGSSLGDTTATTEAEIGVSTGDYELEVSIDNYDFPTQNIGIIPDETADEIIKTLKEAVWEKTDIDIHFRNNREDIYEEYDENTPEEELGVPYVFNITCTGAEEFVYSIGFNGYSYLFYEGEEAYYFNGKETYFEIMDIVATTFIYREPETYSDPLSQKVAHLFYSNKDIIKPSAENTDIYEQSTSAHFIFSAGPYHIVIDKTGLINVRYEGFHNEEKVLSYDSSPEFANDVAALVGVDFESEETTEITSQPTNMPINEKLINLLDNPDFIENGNLAYYTGQGQFSKGYNIGKIGEVGGEELIKHISSYEWTPAEDSDYMRSDFITINYNYGDFDLTGVSISVNDKGELYDRSEGVLYRAENVDTAELEEVYKNTAVSDCYTQIAYSLCTRGDDFTTLESDISIYYDPLDETGEHTPVNCTGKMYYKNITNDATKDCYGDYYYIFSDAESGYSGEMYKQGRYWAFIEKGNSIAKGYYEEDVFALEDAAESLAGYWIQRDNYTLTGGYDNYNAINIDYDMLCQEALYTLNRRDSDYYYVRDEEIIIGQFSNYFKLEYNHVNQDSEEFKKYSEILEFRVTDEGELIYFSKSRRNLETGEITPYLTFQMYDGICNSMGDYVPMLDNPDFAIPQPSEELAKEFELINET